MQCGCRAGGRQAAQMHWSVHTVIGGAAAVVAMVSGLRNQQDVVLKTLVLKHADFALGMMIFRRFYTKQ